MMRIQLKKEILRNRPQQSTESELRSGRKKLHQIQCNLCQETFQSPSRFMRFCRACKAQNELFRFYESLCPEAY